MSLLLQITIFLGAALLIVPLGKRFGIATVSPVMPMPLCI